MSKHDSRQIETVKVVLHKGDKGSSIEKIEKTGTDVLVDTYTITLTDGSKQTFTVTNGKGIDDVEKTSQGLVDTYTITFNDGTDYEFTVANGKGIDSIEKTGTQGLVDTYTITFNDGQSQTFTVTNGRAIEDIQITGSQGLTDIYTIYFNDGTTLEIPFTKTNVDMDTELSNTSTNPVENRVITNALGEKSNTGHTHNKSDITDFAHTHDDRYYTESEINTKLSAKQNALSVSNTSVSTTVGQTIYLYKYGRIVSMMLYGNSSLPASNTVYQIATIPQAYRPIRSFEMSAVVENAAGNVSGVGKVVVKDSGAVNYQSNNAGYLTREVTMTWLSS